METPLAVLVLVELPAARSFERGEPLGDDGVDPLAGIASAHQAFERGGVVGKQGVAVSGRQEAPGSGSRVPVTTVA